MLITTEQSARRHMREGLDRHQRRCVKLTAKVNVVYAPSSALQFWVCDVDTPRQKYTSFSLCTIKQHATKELCGSGVQLHGFLTTVIDRGD